MARYWVYLNDEVCGPFALEQLIRQRGFSRQTLVCIDDASGSLTHWISPAEIPELAHIFKAADDQHSTPVAPAPKAPTKAPTPRPAKLYTPAVTLRAPSRNTVSTWIWAVLTAALLGGGFYGWSQWARRGDLAREQGAAQALVENARLPAPSPYSTLQQYIQEKSIKPRWEFEKIQDALDHVTLSWYAPALTVYAFEANIQAQTVRGLNTAAATLLSEGFPAPLTAGRPKPAPASKKSAEELFPQAIDSYRDAVKNGDFAVVWDGFSQRKKSEMVKGGISRDGFMRLQGLTHRVESSVNQTVLKTKSESDTEMLVLLKQSQDNRADIFIKELWVFENGTWKMDDEQKRSASTETPVTPPSPAAVPAASAASPGSDASKPSPASLPGMSR